MKKQIGFYRKDMWDYQAKIKGLANFVVLKLGDFFVNKFKEWLINSVYCSEQKLFSKIDTVVRTNGNIIEIKTLVKSSFVYYIDEFNIVSVSKDSKKFSYIMHQYYDTHGNLGTNEICIPSLRNYAVNLLGKAGIRCADADKSFAFFDKHVDYNNIIRIISKMRDLTFELRTKAFQRLTDAFKFDENINKGLKIDHTKLSSDHEIDVEIFNETIDTIKGFNTFILDILGYDEKLRGVQPIKFPNGDIL